MRQLFGWIFLSALFLMATCEKDQILPPDPELESCLLQETTWSLTGDPAQTTTDFIYNANDQLIEVVRTSVDQDPNDPWIKRWVMTYTGGQLQQLKSYVAGDLAATYDFFFMGSTMDSVWYEQVSNPSYEGYYLMDYEGDLPVNIRNWRYNTFTTGFDLYSNMDLSWENENVKRVETEYHDGVVSETNYVYDDQRTPFYHAGLAFSTYAGFTDLSANNITSYTRTDTYPGGTVYNYEHAFSYTYNDLGYPTSKSQDGGTPTYYHYLCK